MDKELIYILNYGWENRNYGAILTAYALQTILLKYFNKKSKIIDNSEYIHNEITKKLTFSKKFKEKYMKFTEHITSWNDYKNLNKYSNTFIVGSDQVFRPKIKREEGFESYFLDFADINAKKIAFSASFGVDKEQYAKENSSQVLSKIQKLLSLFDAISVREQSGVDLSKELFNIEAQCIIDPVFMLEKSDYEKLIKNSKHNFENKIITYIINENKNYKTIKKYLRRKYKKTVFDLFDSNLEVEDWLNAIKNCDLFVTDSFHGFCFSIIFNKPCIAVVNSAVGEARYRSVSNLLNIENCYIFSPLEILKKDCVVKFNQEEVLKNIKLQQEKGLDFLQSALEKKTSITENDYQIKIEYLEEKIKELTTRIPWKQKLKKFIWKKWVIFFHTKLPMPIKNLIRRFN